MSNYIGNTPGFGQGQTFIYILTAGQSSVSGPDALGRTLAYTPGLPMIVAYNGALQSSITDYTATNGNSITFNGWTANAGDELVVIAFAAFALADALKPSNNLSDLASIPTARGVLGLVPGVAAGNIVQLDNLARLPAVDGSLLTGIVTGAPILNTQTLTANGNWTNPNVGTWALIVGMGGGGGGGGGQGGTTGGRGGGGGGSAPVTAYLVRRAELDATVSVTIGAGGTGGAGSTGLAAGTNGTDGGNTLFGNSIAFRGGLGGGGGSIENGGTGGSGGGGGGQNGLAGGAGGANGTAGAAGVGAGNSGGASISTTGSQFGTAYSRQPGAGGGGGGRTGSTTLGAGGAGGAAIDWLGAGGAGGAAVNGTGVAGSTGSSPGGGGGGGGGGTTGGAGGNGAGGGVRVYVF